MAERLFGTDGVRGTAGVFPLEPVTVGRLGAALVRAIAPTAKSPALLVGRDTRESGAWIERELGRGIRSEGASVVSAGILPTPAIAYLTRAHRFDAGVVFSAAHNPYQDNGIKIFSGRGEKSTDHLETEIERMVADRSWQLPERPSDRLPARDFTADYVAHAMSAFPNAAQLAASLPKRRVIVDCANGATSFVAPLVLRTAGFEVTVLNANPDGRNINRDSGSTHPDRLAGAVRAGDYLLGVAFDGDGDRAILVDPDGRIVNGDGTLLACAKHLKANDRLRGNAVVATVMSNLGLELALRERDIDLIRCPVGDKYVTEEMARRNVALGGEQSGHIIFADHLFTGDGIATALCVLRAMAEMRQSLAALVGDLRVYPQVLMNVPVRQKHDLRKVAPIADAMARVERQLAGQGRLLVRYSGTEPLLRVMIEGRNQDEIHAWAEEIAHEVRKHLG